MKLEQRIALFAELGSILRNVLNGKGEYAERLNMLIERQQFLNAWFTPQNVRMAIDAIAEKLTGENLRSWTGRYPALKESTNPSSVAVIMAGNIPLVGFHDFLSVLISGNSVIAKSSSKDSELMPFIAEVLCSLDKEVEKKISFAEGNLSGFDAVIATGSDNSSRYFEYYFGKYPHIIRKNRNSAALITGNETNDELSDLGKDVFSYFGLGCRNVSKLYLPSGYDIDKMIKAWSGFSDIMNHSKYANNYEYNMAVWLVNREKFLETGFVLLKENQSLASPVATLYYEYYDSIMKLETELGLLSDRIQCIVGRNHVPFGSAQYPELWDYADNSDTLDFLLKKNMPGIS